MENQFYPIKLYFNSLPNKIAVPVSLVINLFIWGWILFNIEPTSEPVFLHYNILFGVDMLGQWWKLYLIPLLGLIITVANFVIGWITFHKDKYISYFLNANSILCQILLVISVYMLVFLNT